MKNLILSLILCFWSVNLSSQNSGLHLHWTGDTDPELKELIYELPPATDSLAIFNKAMLIKKILYDKAYFLSEAELVWQDNNLAHLQINTGKQIKWGKLKVINSPEGLFIPRSQELLYRQANVANLDNYLNYHLNFLEDNGYPFASLTFDDYQLTGDTINGSIIIETGPLVKFDSIVVKGFDDFPEKLLRYELGFKKKMLYNESFIRQLSSNIQKIEYLSFNRTPAIAFSKNKTVLYLYTSEVKSNQVDGIIGLNTSPQGKVEFTGDFKLRLLNALHKGEEFKLEWQRPDASVSNLELGIGLPYLFKTPFWTEANISIFKQDSSFVNTELEGLIKYIIESGSFLSLGVDYRTSNVLSSSDVNSDLQSFNSVFYKLGYERRSVNRVLIPTSGNDLRFYVFNGKRKSSGTNQDQYGWQLYDAHYFQIFNSHILKLGLLSESLIGNVLLDNELYRIGGLRTLRGFNEKSIYSSRYGIGTVEYRYMIGDYDYLTLFSDMAYTERPSGKNWLLGIGGGINFRTAGGIFSLFYALGKTDNTSFDFKTSKIHFGYVNRF